MKTQGIYTLLQVALILLLAACTREEFPAIQNKVQQLTISITDGGYASVVDNKTTRAVENGYTTAFTEGDACGLYVVRGTQTLYSNVKLTAGRMPPRATSCGSLKIRHRLWVDCRMSTTTSTIPTKRI